MKKQHMPVRSVAAYDSASGRILHVHFTQSSRPQPGTIDPAEGQLRRYLPSNVADVRLLHVEPDELKQGLRYRVDPATGKLILAGDGEHGFAASAGSTRRPAR